MDCGSMKLLHAHAFLKSSRCEMCSSIHQKWSLLEKISVLQDSSASFRRCMQLIGYKLNSSASIGSMQLIYSELDRSAIMKLTVFLLVLLCFQQQSEAQSSCDAGEVSFSGGRSYGSCARLPYLNATLFWTYQPSNGTLHVAYRALQRASGWVAWAINPAGHGMVGANSLLAFPDATTGAATVITTQLRTYDVTPRDIRDEELTFAVYSREAEYSGAGGCYTIYASVELPGNRTTQNTVWQEATTFSGGVPYGHPFDHDHLSSFASLDFLTGELA